jgi:DNA-binding MarR family transcriptional regulator
VKVNIGIYRLLKRSNPSSRLSWIIAFLLLFTLLAFTTPLFTEEVAAGHLFNPNNWDVAAQDTVDVEIYTELYNIPSGTELPLKITVTHMGYPESGATVNISAEPEGICTFRYESEVTDVNGQMIVYLKATVNSETCVDVEAVAQWGNYTSYPFKLRDIAIEPVEHFIEGQDILYVGIGGGVMALAMLGATEAGSYALLKLIVVPLYSRIRKDDVLDHFVRGQIYGYIMSHPGEHYNGIKQALKVNNGTLSHHLRTLEMQGYLKSQRDGTYKRFYPTGTKLPRRKGIQLSDLQMEIVDAIRQIPGLTQKDIAMREGITQQSVSYNLKLLERIGVLKSERDGVRKRYFILQDS